MSGLHSANYLYTTDSNTKIMNKEEKKKKEDRMMVTVARRP